jgi:formylmethanofuran dehydrogenase subunit E
MSVPDGAYQLERCDYCSKMSLIHNVLKNGKLVCDDCAEKIRD